MARMIDKSALRSCPQTYAVAARAHCRCRPPENIEILVYLRGHNKVFGEQARMTLADGTKTPPLLPPPTLRHRPKFWIISSHPDNLRQSYYQLFWRIFRTRGQIIKLALFGHGGSRFEVMLKSERARSLSRCLRLSDQVPI